mmetsp:Transcript_7987/g.29541  ORF Transcript_7987/g.29541 Transcript_7987/m.29541 type:complete len:420 (-) Transcript_7987:752-2011(-)
MGNESSTLAERDYRILAEEYRKHVECNVSKKSVAAAAAAGEGWPTEISALWPRLQGKELQAALRGDWRGHGSAHISILKGSKSGAGASSMSQARSDFLRRAACALTLSRMANASASDSIEEGHHHYRRSDGQQHDKTSSQQPTPRHAKGSGKQQSRSKQNGKLDHPHDYNNGTTTSGFGSTKRGSNGTVNHHCQIAAEQDNEELPTLSEDYSTEHGPDGEEHTLRKRKASQRTRTSSKRYRYSDDDGDEQALDDENEIHADGSEGDGRYHSNSHPFSNMPLKPMNGELPQGTRLQTMKARHSGHAVFEDMQLRACPFQAGSVVVYNLGHIEPERYAPAGRGARCAHRGGIILRLPGAGARVLGKQVEQHGQHGVHLAHRVQVATHVQVAARPGQARVVRVRDHARPGHQGPVHHPRHGP